MKYKNYKSRFKKLITTINIKNNVFSKSACNTFIILIVIILISVFLEFSETTNSQPKKPISTILKQNQLKNFAKVIRIVDADTIEINYKNRNLKARLMGIDTPETVHPEKKVECYGKEATLMVKKLLENQDIYFNFDKSQSKTDIYHRLLLYVWRADDNLFINEYLVSEGYAKVYETTPPFRFNNKFKDLESEAKLENRGLWSNSCN